MIKYTETSTYVDMVSRAEIAIQVLVAERDEIRTFLASVKRGARTPGIEGKRKRRDAIGSLLKTKESNLHKVTSLTLSSLDLVRILLDCDDTTWKTPEQLTKWHKELASHEGRGEASLRDWYGLPDALPSQRNIDITELGIEAKNIQGRRGDGKFALQTIQAGSGGRRAYSMWMGQSAESGMFKELPNETRQSLFTGEITRPLLYNKLPTHIRDSLLNAIRPSIVFAECSAIDCTTCDGFLHLPKEDFDVAWGAECVTKCGPKYTLRKSYLLDRLKATLSATQHVANVTA